MLIVSAHSLSINSPQIPQISLGDLIPDARRVSARELHGPCPFCGGHDRFVVFRDQGRAWCRQCGWSGDGIQLLRDRDGLTFREAVHALGLDPSPPSDQRAIVHNFALEKSRRTYMAWQREQLIALTDLYRFLVEEQDIAVIAYKAIHKRPTWYTEDERQFWTKRLAAIYDRLPALEHELDILTYTIHERGRFRWWRSEARNEN